MRRQPQTHSVEWRSESYPMHSKVPIRYYSIPLIYLLIIAALLYGYFGRAVKIRERAGDMAITATIPARSTGSGRPDSLEVAIGDIRFDPGSRGIVVRTIDGQNDVEKIESFRIDGTAISLRFDGGIELSLDRIGQETVLSVRADSEVARVGLRFRNEFTQSDPRVPVFFAGESIAILPPESSFDKREGVLFIAPEAGTINFAPDGAIDSPFLVWIDRYLSIESDPGSLVQFIEATYTGWTGSRYSGASASWIDVEGTYSFDEETFAMMVGESLARGGFRGLYPRILQIAQRHSESLTHISAPLLGNIVTRSETRQEADNQRIAEIRSLVKNGDPAVFHSEDLVPFLFDRGPYALVSELIRIATTLESGELSPRQAVGALWFLFGVAGIDADSGIDRSLVDLVERLVIPHLQIAGDSLYVGSEVSLDTEATIRAGLLLREINEPGTQLHDIGSGLLSLGLGLAGDHGFLPISASVSGRTIVPSQRMIRPEPIFAAVNESTYAPTETTLFPIEGPGVWMWSSAGAIQIDSSPSEIVISFDFPVGFAHHFMVVGLESFESIAMFGIPWKSDPLFQNYTSGWLYSEEIKTLFVKLTHRATRERITISR